MNCDTCRHPVIILAANKVDMKDERVVSLCVVSMAMQAMSISTELMLLSTHRFQEKKVKELHQN